MPELVPGTESGTTAVATEGFVVPSVETLPCALQAPVQGTAIRRIPVDVSAIPPYLSE